MPEAVDTFQVHAPESKHRRTPPNNTEFDEDDPGHGAASRLGGMRWREKAFIALRAKQACAKLQASCLKLLGPQQVRGLVLHFCQVRTGQRCRAGAGKMSYYVEHRVSPVSTFEWSFSIDLSRRPPHTQGPPLRCTYCVQSAQARRQLFGVESLRPVRVCRLHGAHVKVTVAAGLADSSRCHFKTETSTTQIRRSPRCSREMCLNLDGSLGQALGPPYIGQLCHHPSTRLELLPRYSMSPKFTQCLSLTRPCSRPVKGMIEARTIGRGEWLYRPNGSAPASGPADSTWEFVDRTTVLPTIRPNWMR
ncbi:predicted protein [Chaetomium globosum CBS 148.51]|uniref:Uncharacterized protein n=1 Tax=Chaetomium globosum (strain ATCC 6205 / CBS 148.51 / DSM 1962 / NBRC 6347 / NRRL 1970) TaxID=306901 RepID=Q2HGQ2_CHAGB|nr:uncharacterized protein CHGG_00602 [Chaetomium globosum CBS 148.51]EAQ92367.1 predicted protein [Chaetomium globosum CBS 148.51]